MLLFMRTMGLKVPFALFAVAIDRSEGKDCTKDKKEYS
jgi:hypothetical protein